ncbi:MAG: transglycosylase SLT domain-containing protein [Pseudomonadota bacterium]
MIRAALLCLSGILLLTACASATPSRQSDPRGLPAARWDHRPAGSDWTIGALAALRSHGDPLVSTVPADIDAYCPAYPEAGPYDRRAFWVGFLSALAKHESTWREDVTSPNGKWHGLLQISPATAAGYGCRATTGTALRDGTANLSCAIRIMSATVTRDGVISADGGGVAADWGPFRVAEKRADIQSWTRGQSYCGG